MPEPNTAIETRKVEVLDAEPVWEVVEANPSGRTIVKIPIPTGTELSILQEAYLIKKSMPGMAAQDLAACMFLVQKARAMGLSAIRGDVSLIEGRVATSDAAKGGAAVKNPKLVEFSVSEPIEVVNPILCSCGHPKMMHGSKKVGDVVLPDGCNFVAALAKGTKTCSCTAVADKRDVFVQVTGKLAGWATACSVKTWLSEWYNPKNDAWVEYTYDRLIAKAIARWGERFSPIGEDFDSFIEPKAEVPAGNLPGLETAKTVETELRGLLSTPA